MTIIIAGAGIGGLATALLLHAKGIECEVYEQAPEVQELGVGLNLLPHAVKILADQGLLPDLAAKGIETDLLILANRFGQEIWREPRGRKAGYDVPQFSFHRGHLQTILLNAVKARLGAVIKVGHRLVGFSQDEGSVTAQFDTGGYIVDVRGTALIGADGIHSVVRDQLFPNQGPPVWSGVTMWRGAHDWPQFLSGNSMTILGGSREKLIIYPIGPGKTEGTRLTNWAINLGVGEPGSAPPQRQDWSRPGAREDLLSRVSRFESPLLDVRGLLEASPAFWEYPMCDRDPLPYWTQGRVTLLGDAAHPMYPMGSNGAGQAILDAGQLAEEVGSGLDLPQALARYERVRLPATAEVVRRNRLGGPEMVIDKVEALAPDGFDKIDDILPFAERKKILDDYAAIASFSKEDVNEPMSLAR
jgi:5-methylphenazine-1-carboxylate 1-monooxygenase